MCHSRVERRIPFRRGLFVRPNAPKWNSALHPGVMDPPRAMKLAKPILLTLLVAAVYLLHQDFWNWKQTEPLVLGFLPIGLAYHAGYSILAACLMAVLVRFAWPKHLENVETKAVDQKDSSKEGHE